MGENEWTDYQKSDDELIAEAIASGKLRRFPAGEVSEWESLAFIEKRKRMLERAKRRRKSEST